MHDDFFLINLTHEEWLEDAEDALLQEGEEPEEGVVGTEEAEEGPEQAGTPPHRPALLLPGQPGRLNLLLPHPANMNISLHTVPNVIDFPRYNMECSLENVILRGIFHVVSRFGLLFGQDSVWATLRLRYA